MRINKNTNIYAEGIEQEPCFFFFFFQRVESTSQHLDIAVNNQNLTDKGTTISRITYQVVFISIIYCFWLEWLRDLLGLFSFRFFV